MYAPGTIANPQMTPTKISKNGAIAKDIILVEQAIATIRHLKAFRIIFIEVLWNASFTSYLMLMTFICLQMYSEKFFNVYFYEQIFFENQVLLR